MLALNDILIDLIVKRYSTRVLLATLKKDSFGNEEIAFVLHFVTLVCGFILTAIIKQQHDDEQMIPEVECAASLTRWFYDQYCVTR